MITSKRLRACGNVGEVFALLRELGYPVEPVEIVASEWRRAGIDVGWSDAIALHLAARMQRLDLYVVSGDDAPPNEAVARFLRSLQTYNARVKPVLIAVTPARMSIHDLSSRRELRRLDVDLAHPTAHALDRLNLLAAGDDTARIFDRALDRESLTRQFFERFRRAVREMTCALRASSPKEPKEAIDAQALLILSRLLFLYFIQQKGWLNHERRFLVDRLDAALREHRSFYATVLRPLFFGCLNTPFRDRDAAARALGEVPYLNGGLFEPSPFECRHEDLELPNELLQRVIDVVFEKFAFSIDESDVAGTHVDPEMLGKVFESLMAEDERASTGSFYTPREIVDVLASRAVVEWLSDGDVRTRESLYAIVRQSSPTPPRLRDRRAFLERLDGITILDPACGSGAFLLSALRIIERIRGAFDPAPPASLRQSIVERSLFGVDLKPEAVRLCELRLWLAIVAKCDGEIGSIQPLPNLDRNILQGNSLLSPTDFLGGNRGDVYRDWVYALRTQTDLIARYRSAPQKERPALARLIRTNDQKLASELLAKAIDLDEEELQQLTAPQRDLFGRLREFHLERCRELHERIAENRRMLERIEEGQLAFFSFDIHFAQVMSRGGFDVVVGNPPWVRNSRIDARDKRMYSERYRLFRGDGVREAAAFHQPDLSIAFFERALSLASGSGVVSLLVPSKLLNAGYAAPLRRHVQSAIQLVALDDWASDAKRHFDADTFPLGMTARPCGNGRPRRSAASNNAIAITSAGESFALPQNALAQRGSEWSLLPPDVHEITARIHRQHAPLAEVLGRMPLMGVKTGDNAAFFLDVKRVRAKAVETTDGLHVPLSAVCRCARGRDVRRWRVADPPWMLWPPAAGWKKPPRWLERLAEARGIEVAALRLSYVRPEHAGIKVVWKDLSRGICAAVLEDTMRVAGRAIPLVPNQTLYAIDATSLDEARVIAALLNSTIVNVLTIAIAERAKDFHFRYFGRTIARVPLPRLAPASASWSCLLRCARRASRDAAASVEIDSIVASLYGVSATEHDHLASFLHKRLGYVVNA